MTLTALTNFIVRLLNIWHTGGPTGTAETPTSNALGPKLNLELRQLHAVSPTARVIFADVPAAQIFSHKDGRAPYRVKTRHITTHRPPSFEVYSAARMRSMRQAQSQVVQWDEDETIGPDIESRETILELAKMTNNAYIDSEDPDWYDLEGHWSQVRWSFPVLNRLLLFNMLI